MPHDLEPAGTMSDDEAILVLLVEDQEYRAEKITGWLRHPRVRVLRARTPAEAIGVVRRTEMAVVLLDYDLDQALPEGTPATQHGGHVAAAIARLPARPPAEFRGPTVMTTQRTSKPRPRSWRVASVRLRTGAGPHEERRAPGGQRAQSGRSGHAPPVRPLCVRAPGAPPRARRVPRLARPPSPPKAGRFRRARVRAPSPNVAYHLDAMSIWRIRPEPRLFVPLRVHLSAVFTAALEVDAKSPWTSSGPASRSRRTTTGWSAPGTPGLTAMGGDRAAEGDRGGATLRCPRRPPPGAPRGHGVGTALSQNAVVRPEVHYALEDVDGLLARAPASAQIRARREGRWTRAAARVPLLSIPRLPPLPAVLAQAA